MSEDFRPTRVTLWAMPKAWLRFVLKPFVLAVLHKPLCLVGKHTRAEYWTFPNGPRDRTIRRCSVSCQHCRKKL